MASKRNCGTCTKLQDTAFAVFVLELVELFRANIVCLERRNDADIGHEIAPGVLNACGKSMSV